MVDGVFGDDDVVRLVLGSDDVVVLEEVANSTVSPLVLLATALELIVSNALAASSSVLLAVVQVDFVALPVLA